MAQSNPVKWILTKGELSREGVLKVEEALGISFPSDYVDCVILKNGGQPIPDTFDLEGRTESVFNSLIDLNIDEDRNIVKVYHHLKERLPGKVYPFADDPFGNYLCFDYRGGKDPSVVFWDHEQSSDGSNSEVHFVCDTFSELLDLLHE